MSSFCLQNENNAASPWGVGAEAFTGLRKRSTVMNATEKDPEGVSDSNAQWGEKR